MVVRLIVGDRRNSRRPFIPGAVGGMGVRTTSNARQRNGELLPYATGSVSAKLYAASRQDERECQAPVTKTHWRSQGHPRVPPVGLHTRSNGISRPLRAHVEQLAPPQFTPTTPPLPPPRTTSATSSSTPASSVSNDLRGRGLLTARSSAGRLCLRRTSSAT